MTEQTTTIANGRTLRFDEPIQNDDGIAILAFETETLSFWGSLEKPHGAPFWILKRDNDEPIRTGMVSGQSARIFALGWDACLRQYPVRAKVRF